MRTTITLIRKDSRGRIIGKPRVEYSKSLLQGFEELLYVQHAQIAYTVPRAVTGLNGVKHAIDADATYSDYMRRWKGNLVVAAPAGGTSFYVPNGGGGLTGSGSVVKPSLQAWHMIPGEMVGVQIGLGNAAIAPNQYSLQTRLAHGKRAAIGAGSTIYSSAASASDKEVYGSALATGVAIMPRRQILVSSIKFLIYKEGNPGNITLYVRPVAPTSSYSSPQSKFVGSDFIDTIITDGNTLPTAAPYEWREFVFTAPFYMYPGTVYAFYMMALAGTSTNSLHHRYTSTANTSTGSSYSLGTTLTSTYIYGNYYESAFDLIGSALAEGLEFSGCEVSGLAVANPNASFEVRRQFRNVSGGALSIAECGMHAVGGWRIDNYDWGTGYNWPFLMARDLVAPAINLLNTEILEVTYTPSIIV